LQNRPDDSEILVSHDQPYHDPYELGREVCFVHVPAAKNYSTLLNAGFEATRSSIVHVVQCGLEVEEGWIESALKRFEDPNVGLVSPLVRDGRENSRVLTAGWELSLTGRCWLIGAGQRISTLQQKLAQQKTAYGLPAPTLAAGFYRRATWRTLRWDTSLSDVLAPLAMALSARFCGWQSVIEPHAILHGETPTIPRADVPFDFRTAHTAERLFWRSLEDSSGLASSVWHWLHVGVETLAALPSPRAFTGLCGRLIGYFQRSEAISYRAQLATIHDQLRKAAEQEAQPVTLPYVNARNAPANKPSVLKQRAA
jgi:hypothetical protein